MEKCGNGVIRRMQTVLQARLSLCRSLALSSPAGREYKSHFRGPGGGNIEPEQPWSEFVSSGKRRRAAVIKTGECDMIDSEDAVSKLPGANICAARSHSQKGQALWAPRVSPSCGDQGLHGLQMRGHNLLASTDSVSIQSSLPGPPSGTQANAAASIGPNGRGPLWTAFASFSLSVDHAYTWAGKQTSAWGQTRLTSKPPTRQPISPMLTSASGT